MRQRSLQRSLRNLSVRSQDLETDRDRAAALARIIIQKQKLGISMTPSQSLMMSREFLLAIREPEHRNPGL